MKSYLLDTHIFLWWLDDNKKLDKKIRSIIEDTDNQIYISAITIWEIIIKKSLSKLEVPENLIDIIYTSNFEELPMTIEHALYIEHLPKIHKDPFDRLLIAQCIMEDLTFITKDNIIKKYDISCS